MGALIAKFRKEKSSYEVLEKLETDIKCIEDCGLSAERQRRNVIANLIMTSVGIYVAGAALIYQYFLPQFWSERLLYVTPLLVFPVIIFVFKKTVAWYYDRKISKNSSKLMQLRATRRKILEEVMEKKTYKEAQKILERFGDKPAITKSVSTPLARNPKEPANNMKNMKAISYNTPAQQKGGIPVSYSSASANVPGNRALMPAQSQRPLPRPVLSLNRSVLDKMVDYLIGDGPSSRFALICTQCQNHNGMALEEEFHYLAFRCAFCSAFNPARKQRPVAPILPSDSPKASNSESSEDDAMDESGKSEAESLTNEKQSEGNNEETADAPNDETMDQSDERDSKELEHQ